MFDFKKIKKVFKDELMQETFEREGIIVVDFYNAEQIEEVKNLYDILHPKDEKGFFSSVLSKDKKYRKTVDLELKRIGHDRCEKLLTDYQLVNGALFVKSSGEESYIHAHQDMTLVDESEFTAISIWTTTVDLTDENGVMYFLPGSHRFFPTYRAPTIPMFYDPIKEEIKDYMIPYYLKAGQAIIFDQSIIHFSIPNKSKEVRIVSNIYFTQKNAKFLICYHDKNNAEFEGKVEVFEQDDSFMTDYEQFGHVFDRPKMGKSLGLKDYNFPQLTIEQLENQFGKLRLREYTPTKKVEQLVEQEEVSKDQPKSEVEGKLPFWKAYNPFNFLRGIKKEN
jgi:ectoine hydroxylase-related dioxygenase (phytanoyl-CoA dioxygenase family)